MTKEENHHPKPLETRENGLRCPKCHCRHVPAISGTQRHFKGHTRRKRRCRHCGKVFSSIEQILED